MQKYFLHLRHLGELVPDREGIEMENIEAARTEAKGAIRDIASRALLAEADFTLESIRICNGKGDVLAEVFSQDILPTVFAPAFAVT